MAVAHRTKFSTILMALFGALIFAACLPSTSSAVQLKPPPGKVFFGVTDTGKASSFRSFSRAVGKRPAVIQTFHSWGNSWSKSLPRWRTVRARPMLHITTRSDSGAEIITPKQIARGKGDNYLLRINRAAGKNRLPMYIRPLGEPNRCLNVYAAVDCGGNIRGGHYAYKWYRSAFRRIAIITRGGGKAGKINRRLKKIGLPKMKNKGKARLVPKFLRRAPVALVWSPLPGGSPTVHENRPGPFWPGKKWVDWVATDFYNKYNDWSHLDRFYKNWSVGKNKPMALSEFGLWDNDGPGFIKRIFAFTHRRPNVRMLVYYQDFGTSNPFRIQNFPKGQSALAKLLKHRKFPRFAPRHPRR